MISQQAPPAKSTAWENGMDLNTNKVKIALKPGHKHVATLITYPNWYSGCHGKARDLFNRLDKLIIVYSFEDGQGTLWEMFAAIRKDESTKEINKQLRHTYKNSCNTKGW